MTTKTEGRHAAEFLVSEANGTRSRSTGTVVSGQSLSAGEVVQLDGSGKLTAYTGTTDTAGDLVTQAVGIMWEAVDASSGDVADAVFIARDAEVNLNDITFPDEATADDGNCVASLALLGIIAR